MNIMFNKEYDIDGNFAHLVTDEYKLDFIMKDEFFKKWPKSLDREYFSNKLKFMNSEMSPEL